MAKTAFPERLESKCLYIPVNLHKKISFATEMEEVYVIIWWVRPDNFLKAAYCFYFVKSFNFFHFN